MKMQFIDLHSNLFFSLFLWMCTGAFYVQQTCLKLHIIFSDIKVVSLFNVCHCCIQVKNMLKYKSFETLNNKIMCFIKNPLIYFESSV